MTTTNAIKRTISYIEQHWWHQLPLDVKARHMAAGFSIDPLYEALAALSAAPAEPEKLKAIGRLIDEAAMREAVSKTDLILAIQNLGVGVVRGLIEPSNEPEMVCECTGTRRTYMRAGVECCAYCKFPISQSAPAEGAGPPQETTAEQRITETATETLGQQGPWIPPTQAEIDRTTADQDREARFQFRIRQLEDENIRLTLELRGHERETIDDLGERSTPVVTPSATVEARDGNPPCTLCGGPHPFDTVVPSVIWNRVIRHAGLPDYLCATCILRAFARHEDGTSFTAVLYGEQLHGVPIEIQFDNQTAKDAQSISEENTALRAELTQLRVDQASPSPEGWQPIETMTRGCVRVLIHCICEAMEEDGDEYCLDGYIVIAEHLKWDKHDPNIPSQSRDGWWAGNHFIPTHHHVTHWMPLPASPVPPQEGT